MGRSTPIRLAQARLPEIERGGIPVPRYDRARLEPGIVHVGVGGFHRAHLAVYVHELASRGSAWGIVGLGLLEADAEMAATLGGQDCLYTLIEKGGGEPSAQIIGSITGFVHAPGGQDGAATELIAAPSTSILSLTITESGYSEPPDAAPAGAEPTTFDRIAAALALRRERSLGALTILSCDNVPQNGDAARAATLSAVGRLDGDLYQWVESHCRFPNSMVDRITPATASDDRDWLRDSAGIVDGWPVVSEPFRQWVMEDDFAGERPAWEDAGALFSDRIHDWEQYKLRMLNAGHSSIAYLSALAGITYVHEAMAVPAVRSFLEGLLYEEAIPTLVEIPGHPREDYAASVLERFANAGVRDQIARLCLDGSAKFATFLMPTIERQLEGGGPVDQAATALAGWARYLAVVDPAEQAFDPAGDVARSYAAAAAADPEAFLEYEAVFTPAVRSAPRFRTAFNAGYERIVVDGPIAAMGAA
ncbi:MAG: mannitol 2-dehydrogenase [Thermoleophilaceae bacterium]|nr:mannitol 2-dehydrogenase [Thermoleophilaceae bacterium]